MAETSGDALTVPTPIGDIEAQRMGRTEAGTSRWQVVYPWGAEAFFGTSAEVVAYAQRRATEAAGKFSGGAQQAPRRTAQPPDA
jgi:hypothetical protein